MKKSPEPDGRLASVFDAVLKPFLPFLALALIAVGFLTILIAIPFERAKKAP